MTITRATEIMTAIQFRLLEKGVPTRDTDYIMSQLAGHQPSIDLLSEKKDTIVTVFADDLASAYEYARGKFEKAFPEDLKNHSRIHNSLWLAMLTYRDKGQPVGY